MLAQEKPVDSKVTAEQLKNIEQYEKEMQDE